MTHLNAPSRIARAALPLLAALALTACKDDLFGSDGSAGNKSGTSTPGANAAPQISGSPATTAKVSQPYDFTPQASDANGDTLRFEIAGRPSWATFNPNTGRLYGTPPTGATGTFAGITISVTDGQATASLPAFSIAVTESTGTGSAQLSWSKPTTNTDGTQLTDLAGYRIYYGRLPDAPSEKLQIASPDTTSASIDGLSSGTWYFSIATYTTSGVESERTRPVWTSI